MSPRIIGTSESWGDQRATFTVDRVHRYTLLRGPLDLMGQGMAVWIMLNPSTANEVDDDPTIRRCISFSRRWGFKYLQVVNLFAFRATDPEAMKLALDPIGRDNDAYILRAARGGYDLAHPPHRDTVASSVICAWGKHGSFRNRGDEVLTLLAAVGIRCTCLGVNGDGSPRHPLYLPDDTQRVPFPVRP